MLAVLATLAAFLMRIRKPDAFALFNVMAAALTWVFLLFYHVNPEYYVLLLPLLALVVQSRAAVVAGTLLMTVPWLVNLFYGVAWRLAAGHTTDDSTVVRLYYSLIPSIRIHCIASRCCYVPA